MSRMSGDRDRALLICDNKDLFYSYARLVMVIITLIANAL